MGRGRQKAKQQRVARDLKYSSQFTDLDALQRELGSSAPHGADFDEPEAGDEDYDDWTGTER
jgi:hypothetical protein